MFSFFKKKPSATPADPAARAADLPATTPDPVVDAPAPADPPRNRWLDRLTQGLRKTGAGITQVFTGTRIDEALYEELESALLMADAGVSATQFLLTDLRRRVKEA